MYPGKSGVCGRVKARVRQIVLPLGIYVLFGAGTYAFAEPDTKVLETKPAANSAAERLFAHHIKPLLNSRCLPCHGAPGKKIRGNLDLGSIAAVLKGGDSGAALIPGDAERSLIVRAVGWQDPDLQMPPKENDRLAPEQIQWLEKWINAGAPWPEGRRLQELLSQTSPSDADRQAVPIKTSGGLNEAWTRRRYPVGDLWSWRPVTAPVPPADGHPIDAFIDRKLNRLQLPPAPTAGRATLIRRATYNLTGLPPTPEATEQYLNDPRTDSKALAQMIERLLASPHYGEHWGRHWLDVVRYADTAGFSNDFDRGNAWRYRDYVIRSFNRDKPWSQFVREQIAGDELDSANSEYLIAVGFLRMGPWELTGMEVPAIARQQFLDDAVNSIGQSFLGHTLRCVKCHDHKFDPIPTRDYYRLYATLNSTQFAERSAPFLPDENLGGFEERRYILQRERRTQERLKELEAIPIKAVAAWFQERDLPYRTREEALKDGFKPEDLPTRRYGFSVEEFGVERMSRKTLARLNWEKERYLPIAFSVYNGPTPQLKRYSSPQRLPQDLRQNGPAETGHILTGGDVFSTGDPVAYGALSALNELNPKLNGIPFPEAVSGRRAALADWVADPGNPLTYRSIVNRIWQWHFGIPLAGNPNNLGATGKKPTHPELLDWLTAYFLESGGSIKAMHRLIMTSETWRRESRYADERLLDDRDPDRTSYASFRPRRLTAEELLDSMLAVSGELNRMIGGIPVRPEINLEVALQPRMVMGTFATAWQPNPLPSQRHRRSVYALKARGLRNPFMEVFDEPDPNLSCEARNASSIAPQVFSLFNSQATHDRAVAFALRLQKETAGIDEAIGLAFSLAFNRSPDAFEIQACQDHFRDMRERHRHLTIPKPEYPTSIVREAVEENTGEKFRFVEQLDFLEDFVPDVKAADVDLDTRALAEICLTLFNSNEFAYIY